MNPSPSGVTGAHLVVLCGAVTSDPVVRELPSGRLVVQFDVTTHVVDGETRTTISTPVAWHEPSAAASAALRNGAGVVVIGTVRRRFFRVAGATQSRTEVVADRVISTRRKQQAAHAVDVAVDGLLRSIS